MAEPGHRGDVKAPLALIAAVSPTDSDLTARLTGPLKQYGFVPEIVGRGAAPSYLRRAAIESRGRPDVVVFAPNFRLARSHAGAGNTSRGAVAGIRDLPDDLLLQGHVRAKTLPIVLAAWEVESSDDFFYDRPAAGCRWLRVSDGDHDVVWQIVEAIRDWRQSLFEHLTWIGYAITRGESGHFRVRHALHRRREETDLLGVDASWRDLRQSGYYIVDADVEQDVPAWRELEDLLDTYEQRARLRRPPVKPETILQEFFEAHPHMIFRGLFESNAPKLRMPDPGRAAGVAGEYVPDFVQSPRALSDRETRPGLLDLKLPKEHILKRSRFHRNFTRHVYDALAQLADYRDRLVRGGPRLEAEMKRRLGYVPQNPRAAVIIGRRSPPADMADLDHRVRTMLQPLDIELVTYDDILDDEEQRLLLQHALLPEM